MAILGYFPEIYEGEMLYSVLARYHRHVGNPAITMTNEDLFGVSHVRASFDVPSYVGRLAERIPPQRGLTAERMVFDLTHAPYYVAFLPTERRSDALAKQASGYASLHVELGINASVVPQVERFRFCPECRRAMMEERGELWWKRSHHLPGVLVCPEHGCSLIETGASFWTRGQHGFVAATPAVCGEDGSPLAADVGGHDLARLREIARASAALLASRGEVGTYEEMTASYRAALFDAGLMRSRNHVDVAALLDAFAAHHGGALRLLPGVLDREGRFDRWLLELVRTNRKGTHPLQHVLLRSFLDALPAREAPFGAGPWKCPNPVADHGDAAAITTVEEKRTADGVTGVFRCGCGYAYTMTRMSDGRLRGPRFKQFGPLLDPALTRLVAEGATLRGAAAALGVHPRAIAATAARLGLGKAWKAPEKVGSRIGRPVMPAPKSRARECVARARRGPPLPRVDWRHVDEDLAFDVARVAEGILRETPPVMVRLRTVEGRLRRPNFIYVRAAKLPRTLFVLNAVCEPLESFQRRRIEWALSEARRRGRVTVSAVMRAAGVKPKWKSFVANRIAEPSVGPVDAEETTLIRN